LAHPSSVKGAHNIGEAFRMKLLARKQKRYLRREEHSRRQLNVNDFWKTLDLKVHALVTQTTICYDGLRIQ
jgi:hypothetical protein